LEGRGVTVSNNVGQQPGLATALPWLWAQLGGLNLPLPSAVKLSLPVDQQLVALCGAQTTQ